MLNGVDAKTMASAYAEARGDFHLMKGEKTAAYKAYEQAVALATDLDKRIAPVLQLKLNQVTPANNKAQDVSTGTSEDTSEGDA